MAIKLDHSDGFPFKDVQQIIKLLKNDAQLPLAVLTDLVVRHTQILKPTTLRSIAALIGVDPLALADRGKIIAGD